MEQSLLNERLTVKKCSNGTVYKTTIPCNSCSKECLCHQNRSRSLKITSVQNQGQRSKLTASLTCIYFHMLIYQLDITWQRESTGVNALKTFWGLTWSELIKCVVILHTGTQKQCHLLPKAIKRMQHSTRVIMLCKLNLLHFCKIYLYRFVLFVWNISLDLLYIV